MTLDPAAVERFRSDLEGLTGETPTPDRKLGLAVSGGPDSMAMLVLAAAAFPGATAAATVDHGLRAESAQEAAMVAGFCGTLAVPHVTLTIPPGISIDGNLQARARNARYHLLARWAEDTREIAWVAVAHQQNDVAESFLMRARRGSGVGGLAAMRARRRIDPVRGPAELLRPLLAWTRSDLREVVERSGAPFVCDPSNLSDDFDRSRMRKFLAVTPELPPGRLALAAANLRHAEDALQWIVDRELAERFTANWHETEEAWVDFEGLPHEIRRRIAIEAVRSVRVECGLPDAWDAGGIDRLLMAIEAGKGATYAGVQMRPTRKGWHFRKAPPRRSH